MFWTRMTIFTETTLMTHFEPLISRNMVLIMLPICISIRIRKVLKVFSSGTWNACDPHHYQNQSPYFCGTERFISTIHVECTVNIEIFHFHFIVWCQYTYRLNAELFKPSDKRHTQTSTWGLHLHGVTYNLTKYFPGFIPFSTIFKIPGFPGEPSFFQVFQVEW